MSFSAATAPEPCPCLCGLTFEALDRRNLLRQGTALCTAVGVNGQACNRPWAAHPREEVPKAPPIDYFVFYRVRAQIPYSKFRKGVHAWVYEIASTLSAFYNGDKSSSIFYSENDLHINILFVTIENCVSFVNKLDNQLKHFQLIEPMKFEREPEEVRLLSRPMIIYGRDYDPRDTDSEYYDVAITRVSHISAQTTLDRVTEFQMVENSNLEDFVGLECYKCHLRGPSAFPVDKDNVNNWLWMSWNLRERFDGLNIVGRHRVPQIAIRFIQIVHEVVEIEKDIAWTRVDVAIECPDADIFGLIKNRTKRGMTVDETRQEVITWVFVQDPKDFQRCLSYKYDETREIWKLKNAGENVTEAEAAILRRSARHKITEVSTT